MPFPRFYKNGEWQEVVTDTRIPCACPLNKKTGSTPTPIYGHALNLNAQWTSMLEKAYAKLHGTYESLNGGTVGEALVDLTGGCCEQISLTSEGMTQMLENGSLWEKMRRFLAPDYVVAC
ncbi:unnamed protein product, partial [Sphacelaria rigidula]